MLYDWSVHLIDQMIDLIHSEPESVFVDAINVRFPEVDDCNKILVRFKNGVRYQIVVDSWCYIGENRWHICGDDGTAVVPTWGGVEGKVIKANIKEIGWEEGFVFTANGRSSTMAPRPVECLQEFDAPIPELPEWEEFFNNFIDVVEGKAELIVKHEANVKEINDKCNATVERLSAAMTEEREKYLGQVRDAREECSALVRQAEEKAAQSAAEAEQARAMYEALLEEKRVAEARIKALGGITEDYRICPKRRI